LELAGETLFTATLRDVTERKERDEMVLQAQRMEAVGQLTGGIAHDFNNLLAIVLGNLDIIDSKLPANSELKALVEPALRAVDRGASLTQRLLAFSRRQTLQVSAVDAGELLGGLSEMLGRSLGEDIDLKLKVEPELWLCETDSGQLEQAVLNLANNARDAMPQGGRLAIDVANSTLDEAAAAQIDDAKPGDYVTISVADEGAGIAPEVMERIFEPFFTTKETGKGTGLGLSMVYGFITQSGGYICAETKVDRGTQIQLGLPRYAGTATAPDQQLAARSLAAGSGEIILVVEDDPDIRQMVGQMVSKLGYETLVAGTGSEALTLLKDRASLKDGASIDLLLTDVILAGGMNGAELAREAGRIVAGLKVIYMSGYAGDALTGRIEIGDEATLLRKPFHTAELADRLHSAFGPQG
jgi:nitrogen-specific signal transduction histidine kinase/ActR/RegA family two-component response regulator